MKRNLSLIVILLFAMAVPVLAQEAPRPPKGPLPGAPAREPMPPEPPRPPEEPDVIKDNLFPPELIMRHQSEIGLQESQRTAIKNELQKSQAKFVDLQWQLQPEQEKMRDLLQASSVDEAKTMQVVNKVLSIEDEIKKNHLTMLIRIKNQLTEEQKRKLNELRPPRPGPPDRPQKPGPQPRWPQ